MNKKLTLVQSMMAYKLYADENGCMYYVFVERPGVLVDSGEAVSPDELLGYTFVDYHYNKIENISDSPFTTE